MASSTALQVKQFRSLMQTEGRIWTCFPKDSLVATPLCIFWLCQKWPAQCKLTNYFGV